MQTSEFYYGLPQNQWDILLAEAEDLLRDENIGAHLVGLYPAGNRIYGIESESPGILCLYVDVVESLINPIFQSGNPTGFRTIYYGPSRSPIIFANLFNWIRLILTGQYSWVNEKWIHTIPFTGDLIYQDNSIDDILELVRQHMFNQKFFMPVNNHELTPIMQALFYRADAILAVTGKFYPCINPDWDKVCSLETIGAPAQISEIDRNIRNFMLGRPALVDPATTLQLITWLKNRAAQERQVVITDLSLVNQIGNKVSELYRFIL